MELQRQLYLSRRAEALEPPAPGLGRPAGPIGPADLIDGPAGP